MQKIIVAVDGSVTSELALNQALQLAKTLSAALIIVHVVDVFPVFSLGTGIDYDRYREIIRNAGLAILEKMSQIAQEHNVKTESILIEICDLTKVSQKLVEAVQSSHADLLILGTHGRRGFNRLILGSVAEETIRISPIPVLLIRAEEGTAKFLVGKTEFSYKRILVAIDGSETSNLALNQAIYFTKKFSAFLCILHVVNEYIAKDFFFAKNYLEYQETIKSQGQEYLDQARQVCQKENINIETKLIEIKIKSEYVPDKIIETICDIKADLLVIGTHGRSGINRFLLGSVAEETVRRAPIPVLLVHGKV